MRVHWELPPRTALAEETHTMRKLFLNGTPAQIVSRRSTITSKDVTFTETFYPTTFDMLDFNTCCVCNDEHQ
jgi:hypothetical protein